MNHDDAINLVLEMKTSSIGTKTLSFVDCLQGQVFNDCFIDLAGQEYHPLLVDGQLQLELWFPTSLTGPVPAESALGTVEVERSYGKIILNKLRVKVKLDYIIMDGRRIYVDEDKKGI